MAKAPAQTFQCTNCGYVTHKWVGQCPECGEWATLQEVAAPVSSAQRPALAPSSPALPITEVAATASTKRPTGVPELDRVLGGGLVPGAVILLAGEPGVGKSTLLLDVAARAAEQATANGEPPVLYVTGEESASQVRSRAERIGAMVPALRLAAESDLSRVIGHVESTRPSLLVVDSVQTIVDPTAEGGAGGTTQVKAVTAALVNVAKTRNLPVLLVGHVTKRACWSTWWTWCASLRVIGIRGCGWCAPSRTATALRMRWAALSLRIRELWAFRIHPDYFCPPAISPCRAPASR